MSIREFRNRLESDRGTGLTAYRALGRAHVQSLQEEDDATTMGWNTWPDGGS